MRKRYLSLSMFICFILASCAIAGFLLGYTPEERSAYAPIDLKTQNKFLEAYNWAREHHQVWIEDAQEVALQFVVADEEESSRRTITMLPTEPGKASVVIIENVRGDSINTCANYAGTGSAGAA